MRAAGTSDRQTETLDWLGPLFGTAWERQPPALTSGEIEALAAKGLLTPHSMTPREIQALAAAVLAHIVARDA